MDLKFFFYFFRSFYYYGESWGIFEFSRVGGGVEVYGCVFILLSVVLGLVWEIKN